MYNISENAFILNNVNFTDIIYNTLYSINKPPVSPLKTHFSFWSDFKFVIERDRNKGKSSAGHYLHSRN